MQSLSLSLLSFAGISVYVCPLTREYAIIPGEGIAIINASLSESEMDIVVAVIIDRLLDETLPHWT